MVDVTLGFGGMAGEAVTITVGEIRNSAGSGDHVND